MPALRRRSMQYRDTVNTVAYFLNSDALLPSIGICAKPVSTWFRDTWSATSAGIPLWVMTSASWRGRNSEMSLALLTGTTVTLPSWISLQNAFPRST